MRLRLIRHTARTVHQSALPFLSSHTCYKAFNILTTCKLAQKHSFLMRELSHQLTLACSLDQSRRVPSKQCMI